MEICGCIRPASSIAAYAGCIAHIRQFAKLSHAGRLAQYAREIAQYFLQPALTVNVACIFFAISVAFFFAFACGFFVGVVGILAGASGTVKLILSFLTPPLLFCLTFFDQYCIITVPVTQGFPLKST